VGDRMSRIRIYGDTSGYIDVKAPDVAGNTDVVIPEGGFVGQDEFTSSLAEKAPSASPTFTGTVGLPLTTNYDGTQLSTTLGSKLDFTKYPAIITPGTSVSGGATYTVNLTAVNNLLIHFEGLSSSGPDAFMSLRLNGDSANSYVDTGILVTSGTTVGIAGATRGGILLGRMGGNAADTVRASVLLFGCKESVGGARVPFVVTSNGSGTGGQSYVLAGYWAGSAITSITLSPSGGTLDAGTIGIWGA